MPQHPSSPNFANEPPEGSPSSAILRAHGLRATRARLLTLAALQEAREPQSHHALAAVLAQNHGPHALDRITVYRNLRSLTQAGIVKREPSPDRIWRYRMVDQHDAHKRSHPHFTCHACGTSQCLPEADVRLAGAAKSLEALPSGLEVTLSGQCAQCSPPAQYADKGPHHIH